MKNKVKIDVLKGLMPLSSLSESRLQELAGLCYLERVSRNLDPFRMRGIAGQTVFLVSGELSVTYPDGTSVVLTAGSEAARYPLGKRGRGFASARAIADI